MKYGYARISTKTQKIERQLKNLAEQGATKIYQEAFTGKKLDGRVEFGKLLKVAKSGDTIIFDSVSRMSRNADDGIKVYFELLEQGIVLEFIKEPHINSVIFKDVVSNANSIKVDDTDLDDTVMNGIREYLIVLAKKQIGIAFDQSEKEAQDIVNRVNEGLALSDKKSGVAKGTPALNKKTNPVDKIKLHSTDFNGNLNKVQLAKMLGVSRPTLVKWINEIKAA